MDLELALQVSGVDVDPLQGPGDPWATTVHHGSSFRQVQVLLDCQEATPVAVQESGRLETVDRVAPQLPRLECRPVFRF